MLLWTALGPGGPPSDPVKPLSAYHDGAEILFTPQSEGSGAMASFGPWSLGQPLREEKPLDKRLNLYVVVPGKEYRTPTLAAYDHSLIVNTLTEDKPREWDIYWCFVLDPAFQSDLRSEHDLLVAAQQSFRPADLFDLEDVAGHEAMAEVVGVRSLSDLKRYRHPDKSLPRVLMVPARLALRATAVSAENTPPQ